MTTTEHLQLIKKECERLLALSEKRTQGEWKYDGCSYKIGNVRHMLRNDGFGCTHADAIYIAACAGRAEAGWRSTIASVDAMMHDIEHMARLNFTMLNALLDAWPIELLTNA